MHSRTKEPIHINNRAFGGSEVSNSLECASSWEFMWGVSEASWDRRRLLQCGILLDVIVWEIVLKLLWTRQSNEDVLGAPASRRHGGSYSRELCFSPIRHLAFEPEGCGWIYLAAAGTAALPGRLWIYNNV